MPLRYERDRTASCHNDVKKLGGSVPAWMADARAEHPDQSAQVARAGSDYLNVAVDDHSRDAFVEVTPTSSHDLRRVPDAAAAHSRSSA